MDGVGLRETRKAGVQGLAGSETRASSSSSAEGASSYLGVPGQGQGQGPALTGSGDGGRTSSIGRARGQIIAATDLTQQRHNFPPASGIPSDSGGGNTDMLTNGNNHESGNEGVGIGVGGVPTFGGGLLRRQHSLDPNHIDCLSSGSGETFVDSCES